jgi:hypothetical protein
LVGSSELLAEYTLMPGRIDNKKRLLAVEAYARVDKNNISNVKHFLKLIYNRTCSLSYSGHLPSAKDTWQKAEN